MTTLYDVESGLVLGGSTIGSGVAWDFTGLSAEYAIFGCA